MPNRSYLYALRDVSMVANSTVARKPGDFVCVAEGGGYCVPLPWIAMFRRDDLVEYVETYQPMRELKGKEIMNPGLARSRPMPELETVARRSPVAQREKVFAQLEESKAVLREVFPEHPYLPDYLDSLRELLERLPHPLFMMDCGEIESMWPERFWREFEFLLDGWRDPFREQVSPVPRSLIDRLLGRTPPPQRTLWRDLLWGLGGLERGKEVPNPRDDDAACERNGGYLMTFPEQAAEALMESPPPNPKSTPEP